MPMPPLMPIAHPLYAWLKNADEAPDAQPFLCLVSSLTYLLLRMPMTRLTPIPICFLVSSLTELVLRMPMTRLTPSLSVSWFQA
jgi:hypothetical protein